MPQQFLNNFRTTLTVSKAPGDLTLTLANAAPIVALVPTGSNFIKLTLVRVSAGVETAWEIVKVTAASGSDVTVSRGEESTTALSWSSGEAVECRLTAASMSTIASVFTQESESTKAYWSGDETKTFSLSFTPKIVQCFLECQATDGSYSINDIVEITPSYNSYSNVEAGISTVITTNTVKVHFPSYDQGQIGIADYNTGTMYAADGRAATAKWKFFIRAYA
jgi:hypothetical protein